MNRISVIGSINVDLVVEAKKRPVKGETIFGYGFSIHPGGKGANQAVAIARLGGNVKMFGCVGDDVYADAMIRNLSENKVDTSNIKKVKNISTGVASITVAENDNSIIVVKGANDCVDIEYIESVKDEILESDFVLMQYEIPMETVEHVVSLCHDNDIKIILNPAPINKISRASVEKADYITPNEHEAVLMFEEDKDIEEILRKYPRKIIVTLGERGASYFDEDKLVNVPIIDNVNVVDTTGAGDTFSGAYVKALADGMDIERAMKFAQCASGMSVEKFGAQEGMPTLEQVEARMKN
jgi:ribokinase